MFRLSITKWMVFASGYANAKVTATWANSKPERSGVAKVKCRPAFGSTAQKTLAAPHRVYSLSGRASRPGPTSAAFRWATAHHCNQTLFLTIVEHFGGSRPLLFVPRPIQPALLV